MSKNEFHLYRESETFIWYVETTEKKERIKDKDGKIIKDGDKIMER